MRRVLIIYLTVYYLLVTLAVVTLSRSGVIAHFDRSWTYATIVFAVALGVLLWVTSRR